MARYNKIFAGPVSEPLPQANEGIASVDIIPGSLVVKTNGEFAYATAASVGSMYIAQDAYLTLENVDTPWKAGDRMIALDMLPHQLYNARVPTGQNLVEGDELTPGANGTFVKAGVSDRVVAKATETYNNDTGSDQLVHVKAVVGYVRAAA